MKTACAFWTGTPLEGGAGICTGKWMQRTDIIPTIDFISGENPIRRAVCARGINSGARIRHGGCWHPYEGRYYAGLPALTCKGYGNGKQHIILACETEADFLRAFTAGSGKTMWTARLPESCPTASQRPAEEGNLWFLQIQRFWKRRRSFRYLYESGRWSQGGRQVVLKPYECPDSC